MKSFKVKVLFVIISLLLISCEKEKVKSDINLNADNVIIPSERIEIWNGEDFSGWVKYVPDRNVNVDTVWTIIDGAINCTGVPTGYLRTVNDYANYKLSFEWRWPAEVGNSGVLLHMSEPDSIWPKCIEAQLKADMAGDFYLMGGAEIKEHINKDSKLVAKMSESSENVPGEWNKYVIICNQNTITLFVNGILQNKGTNTSIDKGKICFQSEGKPIQFRNIVLENLE